MANPVTIEQQSVLHRTWELPKTASVDCSKGDFVTFTSGYVARGTSSSTYILGTSGITWTNDALHTAVPVIIDEFATYLVDASTTLVQASHVGNAYDLSDHVTINLSGTTYKVLRILGISAGGRAICAINKNFSGSGAA